MLLLVLGALAELEAGRLHASRVSRLRDQIRRLRNHASVFVFLYGSDNSPNAEAEKVYLKVFEEEHWPNPSVSSAAKATTVGTGPTGVKMTGPYEYVAPNYWLLDQRARRRVRIQHRDQPRPGDPGAREPAKRCCPKEHLWPIDEFWNFHAGGGGYRNVNVFTAALEGRYGKAQGPGRLSAEEPGDDLRGRTRHVRGLRPE